MAPDFGEWVQLRGAALLRFAYLITRDRSRAEEAVQDALVSAYSRWSRINGDPEAYLRRAVVNADISRWRKFFRRLSRTYLEPLLTGPHTLAGWSSKSGLSLIDYRPPAVK